MATATPPTRRLSLTESQQRVRHPLEKVRGIIRSYVGLEGAALLLTLLAIWFWVSLVLDYGVFRAFDKDWVQDFARPVRALVLGCFFLLAVVALRAGLIARMVGEDLKQAVK